MSEPKTCDVCGQVRIMHAHGLCKTCYNKRPDIREAIRKWRERNARELSEAKRQWYLAHIEETKKRAKNWYSDNRERARQRGREWRARNPARASQSVQAWRERNKDRIRDQAAAMRARVKATVFDALGNACACCGETESEFLTLDHVQGGGCRHRAGKSQTGIYRDVIREGFPRDKYRLLCWNCNLSYGQWGYCPHQKQKQGVA